ARLPPAKGPAHPQTDVCTTRPSPQEPGRGQKRIGHDVAVGQPRLRVLLIAAGAVCMSWAFMPPAAAAATASAPIHAAAAPADYFSYPLPTWQPHCLGFASQWRLCDGTILRRCSSSGAIWLHTGVDITTGIQPVAAAANGVIAGYIVDPTFRGGVLIRHDTAQGVVLTQYWHVW